jgi:hypothetical protein
MWLSADPAMGEYIPQAPINDDIRKQNQNLPGMGGVFNYVNLHAYHYAGNNPVKLKDPDGRKDAQVQELIDILGQTDWARSDDGRKTIAVLNELNEADRITILDTPRVLSDGRKTSGGYDARTDTITITKRRYMALTAAALAHEGLHAVQIREGDLLYDSETDTILKYDFTDERRAYDAADQIIRELFEPSFPPTSDEYIHYHYDDLFTE